ncbi:MAG: SUMF1/EgtB/PvdO family nonheme iron enzyme, partial [Planctomycetota bacterium]
ALVDPNRATFGQEARGVAIATDALTVANESGRPGVLLTLAWGRLALGDDDGALDAAAAALAASPADTALAAEVADVRGAVGQARSVEGQAAATARIAELAERVAALDARVDARRRWRFPDDAHETQWWHDQLDDLVAGLDGLRTELDDPERLDGVDGWSVPKRLAHAEQLTANALPTSPHAAAWNEELASIRASHPSLAQLEPHPGLVPLGPSASSGLWEFAHLATGELPERGAAGELQITEATAAVFVLIPGDSFLMGAQAEDPTGPNHDPEAQAAEGPPHRVELRPFYASKYELTQAQWLRLSGQSPSVFGPSRLVRDLTHPVENVSRDAALETLGRFGMTLPTEARWEYLAQAGQRAAAGPIGQATEPPAFNTADRSALDAGATWDNIGGWPDFDDGFPLHAPVGSFPANRFGLHDLRGNVQEWCLDAFDSDGYARHARVDPVVRTSDLGTFVFRGGAFRFSARRARISRREQNLSGYSDAFTGVRPVAEIAAR